MSGSISRAGVLPEAAQAAARLAPSLNLADFRLAGGTALAWHLGHRVSEDLDFFTFTPGRLAPAPAATLVESLTRVDPRGEYYLSGERTVHGNIGACQVSFFELDAAWLDSPTMVEEGFGLASVQEVAAMKMVAVMTRSAKKDFYDIAALSDAGLSLAEMFEFGRRMYPGFEQARVHLLRSLVYFEEAELDPDPVTLIGATWPDVKRRVQELVRVWGAPSTGSRRRRPR